MANQLMAIPMDTIPKGSLYNLYVKLRHDNPVIRCSADAGNYFFEVGPKKVRTPRKRNAESASLPPRKLFKRTPRQTSRSHILGILDDDCLAEIFNQPSLDASDLCSMGRACDRFNGVAKKAYGHRHSTHVELDADNWPLPRCEDFFRHFGSSVTSINIVDGSADAVYEDIVLGLIAYHCPNVEKIACGRLSPIQHAIQRAHPNRLPFGRLQALTCDGRYRPGEIISPLKLPNLTQLQLSRLDMLGDGVAALDFFASHHQLTLLKLEQVHSVLHIAEIVTHLPHLETLAVEQYTWQPPHGNAIDYSGFGRLQRLADLSIKHVTFAVEPIMAAIQCGQVRLERFSLYAFEDKLPQFVQSMQDSIRYLNCYMSKTVDRQQLLEVLTKNCVLEEICIVSVDIGFGFIRKLVQHAPALKSAEFYDPSNVVFDASIIGDNREAIDAIDTTARARAMRLHVTVPVAAGEDAYVAGLLRRCGEWLLTKPFLIETDQEGNVYDESSRTQAATNTLVVNEPHPTG